MQQITIVVQSKTSSAQCTHLATRLTGTTTATARTENHSQWHAVLLSWRWAWRRPKHVEE